MLVFCKQFIGAFSVKKLIVLIGFLMCLDARAGIIDFDDQVAFDNLDVSFGGGRWETVKRPN
jgi:hypothetical protein